MQNADPPPNDKGLREFILQVDQADEQRTSELVFIDNPVRGGTWKVAWMAFCFLLLFIAFNVAQSTVTTLYPDHGFYSLALIYSALLVGSLVAPKLIPRHLRSPRLVFFLAGLAYSFFVLSLNLGTTALLLASVGVGLTGSLLWMQQGLYVTGVSQRGGGRIGRLTALFFAVFNINMVLGNIILLAIDASGYSNQVMIWVLASIGGLATLCFLGVRNLPAAKRSMLEPTTALGISLLGVESSGRGGGGGGDRSDRGSILGASSAVAPGTTPFPPATAARPLTVLDVCRASPMRELIPMVLFNGMFTTLIFGNLPQYVDATAKRITPQLALVYICYGTAAALGAAVWGRLFDSRGPRFLLTVITGLGVAAFTVLLGALAPGPRPGILGLLMATSALFGALETSTTTMINTCISTFAKPLLGQRETATAMAFSLYRIMFCIGFIFMSLVSAAIPRNPATAWIAPLVINVVVFAAAIVSGFRLTNKLPTMMAAARSRMGSTSHGTRIGTSGGSAATSRHPTTGNDQTTDSVSYLGFGGNLGGYAEALGDDYSDAVHGGGAGGGNDDSYAQAGGVDVSLLPMHTASAPRSINGSTGQGGSAPSSPTKRIAQLLDTRPLEARVVHLAKMSVKLVKGDFEKLEPDQQDLGDPADER
ncbi:hypothetical protein H9P43_001821 [Blastocladiella emersonii ATCC 22665]|nr:hypothetical protein H9P43_001821 [Blastocladiella emersonii ATCC 22665]